MAESFFAALKSGRVHRTQYPTRERARRDVGGLFAGIRAPLTSYTADRTDPSPWRLR